MIPQLGERSFSTLGGELEIVANFENRRVRLGVAMTEDEEINSTKRRTIEAPSLISLSVEGLVKIWTEGVVSAGLLV